MNCTDQTCGNFENEIKGLSVAIIDTDKKAVNQLEQLLKKGGINDITSIGCNGGLLDSIKKITPDVVFVDEAKVAGKDSVYVDQIHKTSCTTSVIITSDKDRNIDLGIGFNNIPVLSKPFNFTDVDKSISILIRDRVIIQLRAKLDRLLNNMCPVKLKFNTRKGYVFVEPEDIVYFKADSNYTHIVLKNNKKITVAKSLHNFDEGLQNSFFLRISRSIIINTTFLAELDRNNKSCLLKYAENEIDLPITKNYKTSLLQYFNSN